MDKLILLTQAVVGVFNLGVVIFLAWNHYQQRIMKHDLDIEKIKIELFERRMNVFDNIQEFIGILIRRGTFEQIDRSSFLLGTQQAKFLFGADVTDYLENLKKDVAHLKTCQTRLEQPELLKQERDKLAEEEEAISLRIDASIQTLHSVFEPYLKFKNWNK